MKSVIIVSLVGSLISFTSAATSDFVSVVDKTAVEEVARGGDHGGGHGHGHGHGHGWGHVYHHTEGTELFSGDEWLLVIPLVLIPIVALVCWYFWGGKGHYDDYGWDRMGYSASNNVATNTYQGAYGEVRGADALDKSTHQRIFNSIQE